MSEACPGKVYATSSVHATKRSLWKRAGNDISNMISGATHRKSAKSDFCLGDQVAHDLDLSDLLDRLEGLARSETQPAVRYLRQLLMSLEGCQTITCTLDKLALKASVNLQADKKHTEQLNFRASNALHLSGSALQLGKNLSFDATLVDDGVLLTNLKGLSVSVTVLKGTFRCDVLQARIQSKDEQCRLILKTRNPLIGKTADDLSQVDLQAELYARDCADESEESKANLLLERRQNARKLRNTATGMRAFDLQSINRTAQATLRLSNRRYECLKMFIFIYAISLMLVASYFYLLTKVPQIVPITMILSAISFFLLGCDREWTSKSNLALLLNVFSMMVVTVCLYQIF